MKSPGRSVLAVAALAAGIAINSQPLYAQYDQPAQPVPQQQAQPAPASPPAKPRAQTQQQTAPNQDQPPAQPNPDAAGPELGGPGADSGAIVIPKKPVQPLPPPPPATPSDTLKNPPGLQGLSLRVNTDLVDVPVGVILEKTHEFVPNLQKQNFRVWEDGVPQTITHFSQIKAPITAVLLLEFAATNYQFIYDMRNAAYTFAKQLQPDDSVAVVTYDMHTQILTDFTQDKERVMDALGTLTIPTWRETNMFDALYTTLDRLSRVPGRKYVILVSSGIDSFSKITLDKTLQKIRSTPDVTIFTIGTGAFARLMGGGMRRMSGSREITYLQGDNELNTFARMTGGEFFAPRFEAEMPDIFTQINESIRNQYLLAYTPTNAKPDGTYRHVTVEVVDDEGRPLRMQDEKHRPLKYDVIAKEGYRAPLPVQ
jgi:VWFA-related protein